MASCLVPEFPAVLVALEHLKELERNFSDDGVSFSAEGNVHLAAIAEAVSELEATRRASREQLEVETIENSKLRQQLKNISDRMTEDILADRAAARASNAEEMEQLRRDIALSSQIQEESGKRLEKLLAKNKALQAERELARDENAVAISSLNDLVSLRFSRKLQLDQRLEQTEELRSSITAAELEKASLLERMAQDRKSFTEEKENLYRKVGEAVGKLKQERKVINQSKQDLEKVNKRKNETDGRLSELSAHMDQLESSLERSKASRCCCKSELQEEAMLSRELNRQVEIQTKDCQEQEGIFSLAVQSLREEIGRVEDEVQEGRSSGLLLKDNLVRICAVYRHRHEEEKEVQADHLRVSSQLERSRLQVEERIASVIKHNKEVREMERQIQELQEEQRINMRVFESKREEVRVDLDAVMSNIGQLEQEIKELIVLVQEEKVRQEEYEVQMTSEISNTRRRYENLLQEEAAFLQLHPERADPDFLTDQIAQLEKEHRQILNIQQQELQQIVTESEKIRRSNEERQRELEEGEKELKQVEAKWRGVKSRHDELTALDSQLNQRRSGLEMSIQDTEEHTRALLQPREDMAAELQDLQENHSQMLSGQNAELMATEINIYKQSAMLEQVRTENGRIRLCTGKMAKDFNGCRQETERHQREVQESRHKAEALLRGLHKAWKQDTGVIQERRRRDDELLVSTSSRLNQLRARNQQLMGISTLLHQLMLEFSKRLGDKATQRQ